MNEIMNVLADDWERVQQTMTTKQLADALGVDAKTIQRAASSLDMNVARVGNNHTMVFTEEQATAIR